MVPQGHQVHIFLHRPICICESVHRINLSEKKDMHSSFSSSRRTQPVFLAVAHINFGIANGKRENFQKDVSRPSSWLLTLKVTQGNVMEYGLRCRQPKTSKLRPRADSETIPLFIRFSKTKYFYSWRARVCTSMKSRKMSRQSDFSARLVQVIFFNLQQQACRNDRVIGVVHPYGLEHRPWECLFWTFWWTGPDGPISCG